MHPRRFAPALLGLVALLSLALAACDKDPVVGVGGSPPDGRFHPQKTGVPIAEDAACMTLANTITKKFLALGCVGTSATCPSLVRKETMVSCAQYDEGTVQGCVKYINEGTDCTVVAQRVDDCAFEAIPNSAPNGCPAM